MNSRILLSLSALLYVVPAFADQQAEIDGFFENRIKTLADQYIQVTLAYSNPGNPFSMTGSGGPLRGAEGACKVALEEAIALADVACPDPTVAKIKEGTVCKVEPTSWLILGTQCDVTCEFECKPPASQTQTGQGTGQPASKPNPDTTQGTQTGTGQKPAQTPVNGGQTGGQTSGGTNPPQQGGGVIQDAAKAAETAKNAVRTAQDILRIIEGRR